MATTAPPSNSSSISNRLFESLATKNYHELIQLYGQVAIQSLEGYQDNLQQWQATAYRHGHSRSERGKQSCCIQMDLFAAIVFLLHNGLFEITAVTPKCLPQTDALDITCTTNFLRGMG
jgi:hypothetical protein